MLFAASTAAEFMGWKDQNTWNLCRGSAGAAPPGGCGETLHKIPVPPRGFGSISSSGLAGKEIFYPNEHQRVWKYADCFQLGAFSVINEEQQTAKPPSQAFFGVEQLVSHGCSNFP